MFNNDIIILAMRHAKNIDVPVASLLAVMDVESAGKVYATVNGKNEPVVRFEGHYFYKRIVRMNQLRARSRGLADPKAGVIKNPISQQARWDKLIRPAAAMDIQAAYESTSWGMGQVMGAHWKSLGYKSVIEMVDVARSGADGQIDIMSRFIKHNGLTEALRLLDWATFARAYNGPAYKQNQYHTKMARAYAKWSKFDYQKLNEKPVDYQKTLNGTDKQGGAPIPPNTITVTSERIVNYGAAPRNGFVKKVTTAFAGVIAAFGAGVLSVSCYMPAWFIQWAGYAAKCTQGISP